jgi:hypothetical protein
MKADVEVLDKQIGVALFFPWELFYDKLPQVGDSWRFGAIRWSRAGGVTWGGKVHEINKWGDLQWDGMTQERLQAIKRKLVMKACGTFRQEQNTLMAKWNDEIHGDLTFYTTLKRLSQLSEEVTGNMDAATVERLFTTAVSDWMQLPYLVQELRTSYVKRLFFSETNN